jgi:hypothetical protein
MFRRIVALGVLLAAFVVCQYTIPTVDAQANNVMCCACETWERQGVTDCWGMYNQCCWYYSTQYCNSLYQACYAECEDQSGACWANWCYADCIPCNGKIITKK